MRRQMAQILSDLTALSGSVEEIIEAIPEPAFDPETDAPVNRDGEVQATLASLLDEELKPAARRLAQLLERLLS